MFSPFVIGYRFVYIFTVIFKSGDVHSVRRNTERPINRRSLEILPLYWVPIPDSVHLQFFTVKCGIRAKKYILEKNR